MTIKAYPSSVRVGATSLVIFTGPPNVRVAWTLTGGGTLEPGSLITDETGKAYAVYTPGETVESVTVEVQHGT